MKRWMAAAALTMAGFAPALVSACEYEAAAAAAATAPARIVEEPVVAATKVPASTVKAPAIKATKQETTRQTAKVSGDAATAKVAVAQRD